MEADQAVAQASEYQASEYVAPLAALEPQAPADTSVVAPVWARNGKNGGRKRRGNPLVSLLVTLLALFGAVTAILGVKEGSIAAGGATLDSWVVTGWAYARDTLNLGGATQAPPEP